MSINRMGFLPFTALLGLFSAVLITHSAQATCEAVENGKKTPLDSQNLQGFSVEKKSLIRLDQQYPALNILEKVFKGEVVTCSNCTDNYIVCGD